MAAQLGMFDCVVIGSGNAGCSAALSASEAGCKKVLVVDVCPPEWSGGNGFFTAAAFRTVHGGVHDLLPMIRNVPTEQVGSIDMDSYTREDFFGDIMRVGDNKSDPQLAHAVVDASRETISWLSNSAYSVNGRQRFWGGLVLTVEDGGKGLIAAYQRALAKAKVDVWYNCRAVEITMENGAVSGIVVEKDGEKQHLRAPAVVLAAGGFEANPVLREKFLGAGWQHAKFTKSGYPLGIMINSAGKRFVDEGEDFRNYTYAKFGRAILLQDEGYAFQVWDSQTIGSLRKEEYGDGVVEKIQADSIEDLALKLVEKGLKSKEEFLHTVKQFNDAVKNYRDENPGSTWNPAVKDGLSTQSSRYQLGLPKSNWALAIDCAPFLAVKVACGVTFTFGGLAIEPETAGVISDKTSKVIPGLFCTGEMVGGLFYGNYPGGSGLMAGAVFGRRAGVAAAKMVKL
ncbi:hypothetical protein C8J57DRAFT_1280363 [Mycena rebaudengoi]|nr:hypothetical protein C8J57DRAFT_1280363 [Mycena rebaudengoi]